MKKIFIILFVIIQTNQAYSNENLKKLIDIEIEKEKDLSCIPYTKIDPIKFAKLKKEYPNQKRAIHQLNFCIKKSEILKLKIPNDFETPKQLLLELKGCKTNVCLEKKATKKVFETFVKKGERWHTKYPGDMIIGMAWFEIMYDGKLKKTQKILSRYEKNDYKGIFKLKKYDDLNAIYGLINMNKGRIKMREALGFTMFDKTQEVINGQLLLGNFLNKDKIESIKVEISPEMKKKKILIEKYQATLAKYKEKLEELKKNK